VTAAATDVPAPGNGTGVMFIEMENVVPNFLESDQTYQVETASGYMLGLTLK